MIGMDYVSGVTSPRSVATVDVQAASSKRGDCEPPRPCQSCSPGGRLLVHTEVDAAVNPHIVDVAVICSSRGSRSSTPGTAGLVSVMR